MNPDPTPPLSGAGTSTTPRTDAALGTPHQFMRVIEVSRGLECELAVLKTRIAELESTARIDQEEAVKSLTERDRVIAELESRLRDRQSQWQFGLSVLDFVLANANDMLPNELPFDALRRWKKERHAAVARAEAAERERDKLAALSQEAVEVAQLCTERGGQIDALVKDNRELKDKCKQTARDFETAFRAVREENDGLRAELTRLRSAIPDVEAIVREINEGGGQSNIVANFAIEVIRRHFATATDATAELRNEVEQYRSMRDTAREHAVSAEKERDELRAKLDATEEALKWIRECSTDQLAVMRASGVAAKDLRSVAAPAQPAPDAREADSQWKMGPSIGENAEQYAELWHNPAALTREQIGDGYRPLTKEELKTCNRMDAEYWSPVVFPTHPWRSTHYPPMECSKDTYRIPLRPTDAEPTQEGTVARDTHAAMRTRQWWTEAYDVEENVWLVDYKVSERIERERDAARREVAQERKQAHATLIQWLGELSTATGIQFTADKRGILPATAFGMIESTVKQLRADLATTQQEAAELRGERDGARLRAETAEAQIAALRDPIAVRANILRGTIAMPENYVERGTEADDRAIDSRIAAAFETLADRIHLEYYNAKGQDFRAVAAKLRETKP